MLQLTISQERSWRSPNTMSVAVETSVSRMSLPVPTHFSHAEQTFSLKKRHLPFSSSSNSNSSYCSPSHLSHSLPPLPPSKGCPPLSRMFPQQPTPWTPLSGSLSKTPPPNAVYDPSKQQSYFDQCYTNLGLLGRGSFGEVYKVSNICVYMFITLGNAYTEWCFITLWKKERLHFKESFCEEVAFRYSSLRP